MPKGAALSAGSTGEIISHFGAVRIRVNGSGNLNLRFLSLDGVRTSTLVPLPMVTSTNIIPTRLANFQEQRAQLEGTTTESGEHFRINRIIIFVKEVFTEYPG
jgi:hypothetical protein